MLRTRISNILGREVSWEEVDRIMKKIGITNVTINPAMFEMLVRRAGKEVR